MTKYVILNVAEYGITALNLALFLVSGNPISLAVALACLVISIQGTRHVLYIRQMRSRINQAEQQINELWDWWLKSRNEQN